MYATHQTAGIEAKTREAAQGFKKLGATVEATDEVWEDFFIPFIMMNNSFAPTYTVYTHMFNWLGWPALSVTCGFIDGLPVGLQLVAKPNNEAALYAAAEAFMKAYPRNEKPPVS